MRLQQSTALIGATLLFCLAAGAAAAQDTLYYNWGGRGNAPDPRSGGDWGAALSDDAWLRPAQNGAGYITDNFSNNDNVVFRSDSHSDINVNIVSDVAPGTVTIQDGKFLFTSATDADGVPFSLRPQGALTVQAGAILGLQAPVFVANNGPITVQQGGELWVDDGVQLTAATLRNAGKVDFADGASGVQLVGSLINSGVVKGTATISTDLLLADPVDDLSNRERYGDSNLTVMGRLVNRQTDRIALSDFRTIRFSKLANYGEFDIDEAIIGNVESYKTTYLGANVSGWLRVVDGVTEVTGESTVGIDGGLPLRIDEGATLRVSRGALTSITNVVANGRLEVQSGQSLTAPQVYIHGDAADSSTINGAVRGDVFVSTTGKLTLGGATINGVLDNAGTIEPAFPGEPGRHAQITGTVINRAGATANLNADIRELEDGSQGRVTNNGTLTMTGSVERFLTNSGAAAQLNVAGDLSAGSLENTGGRVDVLKDGRLSLVDGALTNKGTVEVAGEVNGDLINEGTAKISGTVRGDVTNTGVGSSLNLLVLGEIAGNVTNNENAQIVSSGTISRNVTNNGSYVVDGFSRVLGDFSNVGNLTQKNNNSTLRVDGVFTMGGVVNAGGFANPSFTIEAGQVVNVAGVTLGEGVRIEANIDNLNILTYGADTTIYNDLTNNAGGSVYVQADVAAVDDVDVDINNGGIFSVTSGGTLTGLNSVRNRDQFLIASGSQLETENFNNLSGTLTNEGSLTGDIVNEAGATISSTGTINGGLTNRGTATLRNSITGTAVNNGDAAVMRVDGNISAMGGVRNVNGTLQTDAGTVLTGEVHNDDQADLAGTVNGKVINHDDMKAAGTIKGDLINEGNRGTGGGFVTGGDLRVEGLIRNRVLQAEPPVGGAQTGPGAGGQMTVAELTTLTALQRLENEERSILTVNGTLTGDVVNSGTLNLKGSLDGTLTIKGGEANLGGTINGNVTHDGGAATMTADLTVVGNFTSSEDFEVAADQTLTVSEYVNGDDAELTLGGTINGALRNEGRLIARNGAVLQKTTNNDTIDLTTSGDRAGDELRVNGGLSGDGTYKLNLDLAANDGNGESDRIVVRGGAATGNYRLEFASDNDGPAFQSRRVLVFDVDESQGAANNFVFSSTGLPSSTERVVYSIIQDGANGDLFMTDALNPAFGAVTGNIALTQSLIGSVVNRPSSPFVPGLAVDPGEKPCGPGAWARMLAGRATAEGSTTNGLNSVASNIEASYRGIQFGGDLACLDGGLMGWSVAAGVLGGVNDGNTSQPVFGPSNTGVENAENTVYSINDGEFRQVYGGVYVTASRDRLSADLQIRRERTDFKIDNTPVDNSNAGLQLADSEFGSNATTISGSLSYSYQLPQEGWTFVPTAGFAFSNISTDRIQFEDATLEVQDSKNRVGFIGGTLSRSFVDQGRNSAILAFGTATVYKDFARDTTSIFTLYDNGEATRTEQLESSNLGVYGELSLGVNYLKVLNAGSARAPRQFNASIRVDGRTGNVLDSYGVTAQVRLQF